MLKTLNVVIANEKSKIEGVVFKRPLHVTKAGGFAVNWRGNMVAVEPVNATSVNLVTTKVVKDTRPATFKDIGRETKAEREAKAAPQPVKKAARLNSVDKAKTVKSAKAAKTAAPQPAKTDKLGELAARYNVSPEKLAMLIDLINA